MTRSFPCYFSISDTLSQAKKDGRKKKMAVHGLFSQHFRSQSFCLVTPEYFVPDYSSGKKLQTPRLKPAFEKGADLRGNMRNTVQVAFITVLALLSVYLIITERSRTDSLNKKINTINERLRHRDQECKERIASLKAAAALEKGGTMAHSGKPSGNLFEKLPSDVYRKRLETVEEMRVGLKLTPDQEEKVKMILEDFSRDKTEVFGRVSRWKGSIFDPRLIHEINGLREEALTRVKSVLSGSQYSMFQLKGYEAKLGLKSYSAGTSNR